MTLLEQYDKCKWKVKREVLAISSAQQVEMLVFQTKEEQKR